MDSSASYEFKSLNQQDIIDGVIRDTDLPSCPLSDYSRKQLALLCTLLISVIQSLLVDHMKIGCGKNLQEWLDTMNFKAGKDSHTSSMRPSSDMPRRKKKTETDPCPTADMCPKSSSEERSKPSQQNDADTESKNSTPSEEESEANLRKDHKRSRRTPSGKKPGGQPGHKGHGFHEPKKVDRVRIIPVIPDQCKNCSHWESCKDNATCGQKHNVYDVEIHIVKKVYQPLIVVCPEKANETVQSEYPDDAKGTNQYGVTIMALSCLLYCFGMVSFNRTHEILVPLLGMNLSPATMLRFIDQLASLVKGTVEAILETEKQEKVIHCDETGVRIDGDLHWIHSISTSLYTFVSIQNKRGKDGMDAIGFLPAFVGTVVHDCWSSYFKYVNCIHAICNAHLERELAGLSKFFTNASKWADDMVDLLQRMLHKKHMAQEEGKDHLEEEIIEGFSREFDALIQRGKELHPIPEKDPHKKGRPRKGRARALLDRMEDKKQEIFRFLLDFDVPYTNNIAEASFRLLGVRRSVGIFRDLESAQNFCMIWSYISTARKHGVSAFTAIYEAFKGNSMSVIFPDGYPKNPKPNNCSKETTLNSEEVA